jgi:hypothetical protein
MTWERFPERLRERLNGPVWDGGLREKFTGLAGDLLSPSLDASCELTTIYVKFAISPAASAPIYAVAWIKNSKKWLVGLALPETVISPKLLAVQSGYKYIGLTSYFYLEPTNDVPSELSEWARLSFEHISKKAEDSNAS